MKKNLLQRVKATGKSKTIVRKKTATVFLLIAVLVIVGILGFFLYNGNSLNNITNSEARKKQAQLKAEIEKNELSEEQKQNLQSELDHQKNALADPDGLPKEVEKPLYIGMAFKAARLRDSQAKELAGKALSFMTEEELNDTNAHSVSSDLRIVQNGSSDEAYLVSVPYTQY